MIEEDHVLPGERFKADVPGVVLDVLRNAGVVGGGGFNLQRLRRQESGKPDRSRRADLHLGEAFFLKVLEQFEKWGKANLKTVVFRKIKVGDRGEYLESAGLDKLPHLRFGTIFLLLLRTQAGDHRKLNVAPHCFPNHAFDTAGDAVDLEERVGQQSDFRVVR